MDDNEARLSTIEDVLAKAVLDIAKIEHHLANLGPLARLSERLAKCEEALKIYALDIESNTANIAAFMDEHKLQGTINASLQGQVSGLRTDFLAFVDEQRNIPLDHVADPALALYGGEQ